MRSCSKILIMLVTLVVALGLGGCGSKDQPPSQPAKEESLAEVLAKSKSVVGYSFDYVMSNEAAQGNFTGKMWIAKDQKMKNEITLQNRTMVSIIDLEKKEMYNCDLSQGIAVKMKLDIGKRMESPDQYIKDIDIAKATVLENVIYDGVKCKVISYKYDGNTESKMWVREDIGFPVRIEATGPDGKKSVIEYKNMKVGPVSEDVFRLPPGIKVMEMGQIDILQPE